jgi:hypothetical protein
LKVFVFEMKVGVWKDAPAPTRLHAGAAELAELNAANFLAYPLTKVRVQIQLTYSRIDKEIAPSSSSKIMADRFPSIEDFSEGKMSS